MEHQSRFTVRRIVSGVYWRMRHAFFKRAQKRARFIIWDIGNSPYRLPDLHLSCFYNRLRRIGRRPTVLALPGRPTQYHYSLAKTLFAMGWRITDDPRADFDVALLWEDKTTISPPGPIEALQRSGAVKVVNGGCLDIRKSRVARVFEETFGYSMEVDPKGHHGLCVCKPERNATHGGRIVKTPVENLEAGLVCHRLVNNVVAQDTILDLRTYIENGTVCLVVRKYRHIDLRFAGTPNLRSEMSDPAVEYSNDERDAITRFCRGLGLDHGTLDILRDVDDGRIFIVDANKTPWGPARALPPHDHRVAWHMLADAFEQAYLPGKQGRGTNIGRA